MIPEYKETHQDGHLSIENKEIVEQILSESFRNDIGVQISDDGRIWICVNGIAYLRFSPHRIDET